MYLVIDPPPLSYLKGLNVWCGFAFFFVDTNDSICQKSLMLGIIEVKVL